jgi:hypothetical protein
MHIKSLGVTLGTDIKERVFEANGDQWRFRKDNKDPHYPQYWAVYKNKKPHCYYSPGIGVMMDFHEAIRYIIPVDVSQTPPEWIPPELTEPASSAAPSNPGIQPLSVSIGGATVTPATDLHKDFTSNPDLDQFSFTVDPSVCECGAEKIRSSIHSNWCAKYEI